ncbi:SMI1/KNR4 family protein [Flammeovirga sp. SJP92]|uniref:SMI1/KNR4 family protein n=1 Tax=Flammeovirga sp. SJP92 TaxID=1775430 RepID=UPI0012F9174A
MSLNPGVTIEEINTVEKEVNFDFPEDFKTFYNHINGFRNLDWTPNMFSLFPI